MRRFFITENSEEVAGFLSRWHRQTDPASWSVRSGDFATMYTTIPHTKLLNAIDKVSHEAFLWHAKRLGGRKAEDARIVWEKDRNTGEVEVRWMRTGRDDYCDTHRRSISYADVVSDVEFLINNIYIENGDKIRRQKLGIPMGTNCSPSLANLFLYFYESSYIDKLDNAIARAFHNSFRYMDDTLSVDNEYWTSAIKNGMYPSELILNDTTPRDGKPTHFLGMEIATGVGNRFRISVYDKRNSFPFPVRRYPQMSSLLPTTIPYGVFVAQLHRGYRICSHASDFITHTIDVWNRLVANGCAAARLHQLFASFCKQRVSKYKNYSTLRLIRLLRTRL